VKCSICGCKNIEGAVYCDECGNTLSVEPVKALPCIVELKTGREYPITKDEVLVGRKSPADNIFPEIDLTDVDPECYISRRHLKIRKRGEKFFIEDLGSSNGTFTGDGLKLTPSVEYPLKNGDHLQLGQTEFIFQLKEL